MKDLGKILLLSLLVVVMCGLRVEAIDGEYVYFTQGRNVTNINTQLLAKKGLLKKEEFGVVATGSYLDVTEAPKESVKIMVGIQISSGKKISFEYGVFPKDSFYRRVPLFQQLFAEDEANIHVYLIFPSGMVLTKEIQEISVINALGERSLMMACSPENMGFYKILRKYNAAIEGGRGLSKSDESEMERAFDNTADKLGKVGLGIKVVKGVIKYGLERAEKKRIEGLQKKYGKDCQIYKMPFYSYKGASLKYYNWGRKATVSFDTSKLVGPVKVFIEVPQMMFGMDVPGARRVASLERLVYWMEIGGAKKKLNEALILAARNGSFKEVKRLVEQGADVDAVDKYGGTALMSVSFHKRLDIVRYLVERGADVNAVNCDGITALRCASNGGSLDVVRYLVEKGAKVNATDSDGGTALMWALIGGCHLDMVEYLVSKGADVNIVDKRGRTALMSTLDSGKVVLAKFLLEKGVTFDVKSKRGKIALMMPSFWGHLDMIKFLLKKGVDVNAVDSEGLTALIWAVNGEQLDIVKLLLENGADVSVKNGKGRTALDYATESGYAEIKSLLEKAGRKSN